MRKEIELANDLDDLTARFVESAPDTPKHTPGPWRFNGQRFILAPSAPSSLGQILIADMFGPQQSANGYLTAAAPKLLTACEKSLRYIINTLGEDWADEEKELCAELRAVIAEAKNEVNNRE